MSSVLHSCSPPRHRGAAARQSDYLARLAPRWQFLVERFARVCERLGGWDTPHHSELAAVAVGVGQLKHGVGVHPLPEPLGLGTGVCSTASMRLTAKSTYPVTWFSFDAMA